ncbi:hypothetical protein DSO57_1005878 [Entomophthora muscae]|uniref:Uncharacterized protein n=1 Tax=Entomophthora muscae TaxID=34485 RepID=A0ACC2RMM3_9FUNG|nr:hypothetical protein DSO57_1005878 [Entomophthora muscae]
MQVVLVSKPGLGESGVGLSIEAGSRDEPASVPGLAHLLEHMVSFEMLEEMAGGIGNGHTDYDRTRFDFQVRPGLLEKTLAKLSKAVSSPVFDSAAVEREARMIELEHMKNMDDEMARLDQAMRVMSNTHHPFSRFYTGTYKTLTCKAKALSQFHAKFYHPHLMKLAIVDARPIHEIKQLVMQSFSSLKGKQLTKRTKPNAKPFLPQHTGFEMKIKASSKRIFLQFEVPPGKTLEVLSRILAHRAKGSILQLLKARAWAYNLECFVLDYSDLTIFTIKISPTNAGINHREDILAIFFSYIDFLKLSSPHSLQAIADEHHTHHTHLSPRTQALQLTTTTPQNNYSHSHLLKTLNKLTSTNLRMFTTGIQIPPTSPIEHWYNTHYQLQPLPQIQPHKHTFLLPHKNILLPNNTIPLLTNILISFPHNIQTPAIANLLTTYLNLHFSLPFQQPNHPFISFHPTQDAIILTATGFNPQPLLHQTIKQLHTLKINTNLLFLAKQSIINSFPNPLQDAISLTLSALSHNTWSNQELKLHTNTVSPSQIKRALDNLNTKGKVKISPNINLPSLSRLFKDRPPLPTPPEIILPQANLVVRQNSSSYLSTLAFYLDMYPLTNTTLHATASTAHSLIQAPLIHQLRYTEELAYSIHTIHHTTNTRAGFLFLVQTKHPSNLIEARLNSFFQTFKTPDTKINSFLASLAHKHRRKLSIHLHPLNQCPAPFHYNCGSEIPSISSWKRQLLTSTQ